MLGSSRRAKLGSYLYIWKHNPSANLLLIPVLPMLETSHDIYKVSRSSSLLLYLDGTDRKKHSIYVAAQDGGMRVYSARRFYQWFSDSPQTCGDLKYFTDYYTGKKNRTLRYNLEDGEFDVVDQFYASHGPKKKLGTVEAIKAARILLRISRSGGGLWQNTCEMFAVSHITARLFTYMHSLLEDGHPANSNVFYM